MLLALHLIFFAIMLSPLAADASTSISTTHGTGYVTGEETRTNLRFELLEANKYGFLYGRADIQSFDNAKSTYTTTRILAHGNISKGFGVALQQINQKGIAASSVGLGYAELRKDCYYGVDIYRRNDSFYKDSAHLFTYWKTPTYYRLYSEGFIEVVRPDDKTKPLVVFSQPSLMFAVTNNFSVGVEYQLFANKNAIADLDESVLHAKMKYVF